MNYEPLKMRPCYKEYLWGGERLKREFHKADAPAVTAESWELACHPDGMSQVAEGPYRGMTLAQLGELDRAGFWGGDCKEDRFPILVKLIDAHRDLSVQVHTSDERARAGEHGKAEMWYVVDAEPQAYIYLGFSQRITKEEFLRRAHEGTILEVLNRVPVSRGDVFYILPGTIHAVGAGLILAEVQQNSNTTFRIYDYKRTDGNGQVRALHVERAAETVDYEPIVPSECRANSVASFHGFTMAEMFSCPYFRAYRLDMRGRVKLKCDGKSFQHLLCVEGEGAMKTDTNSYLFRRGESYFLPAALGEYLIEGQCRMLLSRI